MKRGNDYLETNVDKLYKMVKKKGKIKISDVVKKMKVSKEVVEEWAKVLEDYGMIKIYYPIIGEPELRLIKKGGKNE